MRVGCAMIGRGELGFQLATTAQASGLMSAGAYSATIWALLLATLLGPYAFRLSMRLTPCGLESGIESREQGGKDAAGLRSAPPASALPSVPPPTGALTTTAEAL